MTRNDKTRQPRVLIIDDDSPSTRPILETLAKKGIEVSVAQEPARAKRFLEKRDYDCVFISQLTGPVSPYELLACARAENPEMPVVMMADSDRMDTETLTRDSVRAIKQGCCDYLVKPLRQKTVEELIDTFLPSQPVGLVDSDAASGHTIVGSSAKLYQAVELAKRVAPTPAPVLISGESGTGKELISALIHRKSKRADRSYIRLNCAALSDSLLESELFGHEKGAFTGAHNSRIGRFEMAHSGTLLLDEITETPPAFQAKLLRVLEQQHFERVGGNDNIEVNVRIISTTNKDIVEEVRANRFRPDLYYRLSAVRLLVPPLRQRPEDIEDLTWHFVRTCAGQAQRRITSLDPAMLQIFRNYPWPGNIRQLRNVVLTSLILGTGPTLSLADVSWLFDELQPVTQKNNHSPAAGQPADSDSQLGGVPLIELERKAILQTLRQNSGNQTRAAKVLGISDRTLRGKIQKYRQQGVLTG